MGLRSAVDQTGALPVVALLVLLWTVVTGISVANTMQSYAGLGGNYVGQTFVGGAVGLLVLLGFAAATAFVYGEFGERAPVPESFPPRR